MTIDVGSMGKQFEKKKHEHGAWSMEHREEGHSTHGYLSHGCRYKCLKRRHILILYNQVTIVTSEG